MTHEVAKVLATSLMPLYNQGILTVLAGLVKTVTYTNKDNKPIKRPVPFGQHSQPMLIDDDAILPNSSERAIVYFEGNDSNITNFENNKSKFRSNVRLICWYNANKFQDPSGKSIYTGLLSSILAHLQSATKLESDLLAMKIEPGTVYDSTTRLFSQYTYREDISQFMLSPYYALGIDIQVTFQLNHHCNAQSLILSDSTNCC